MNRLALFLLLIVPCQGAWAHEARTEPLFQQWRTGREAQVLAFEAFLRGEKLADVIPLAHLLRTASDWQRCNAEPFEVPPPSNWPDVGTTLRLVAELQRRQLLPPFEVHSAYRNPALNDCAQGAAQSAHKTHFALDIVPAGDPSAWMAGLCRFWRDEGRPWNMGLSRYSSGRIHIDTKRYRTWGSHGTTRLCHERE